MESETQFLINLESLRDRIKNACQHSNRAPSEVKLMAVTKTHPVEAAEQAIKAGILKIGENRVQEAAGKRPLMNSNDGYWELIGPLQSNKSRLAVRTFDRIQTVDRLKLIHQLDRISAEEGKGPYPVLLQVNVGEDPAKSGCLSGQSEQLAAAVMDSENLKLEGLMTIGEFSDQEDVVRPVFAKLRQLRDQLEQRLGIELPELSMGMSDDLEWAIMEGSTLVRVGTALFGTR